MSDFESGVQEGRCFLYIGWIVEKVPRSDVQIASCINVKIRIKNKASACPKQIPICFTATLLKGSA
jgi:hypothetical protein